MIKTDGIWFKDEHGRTLLLRGVNLGGSTKVPVKPNGATWNKESFFDHRNVSFVGRPFPLAEADEHFRRLKEWGLTFLRFLVTWEAIEHAGPDLYDQEYLDYVYQVVKKAGEYGISMFIDPHQDVWSRFSGGDGAPGWTFEAVGLDVSKFHQTGAAIVHQLHGDPFPRMVWPSNMAKLASATMFSLFFAGNDLAPHLQVDGQNIQDYLQGHYIAAIQQVARKLKDLPNVVGYDSLNEPSAGWIGAKDLNRYPGEFRIGACPTLLQSLLLASGITQTVEVWEMSTGGAKKIGSQVFNQGKDSAWLADRECVWKNEGVWDIGADGQPRILKPHHFSTVNGRLVDFNSDYLKPFINRYAAAIREIVPETLIFVESAPGGLPPKWGTADAGNIVSAIHWYDGMVLFMKDFQRWMGFDFSSGKMILGAKRIRQAYKERMNLFKKIAHDDMGSVPTLIGEIGIPYDLQKKKAFRTGDFRTHVKAMDRSMTLMDDSLLNYTIWNYTADNTNARGDLWNDEDLSIFSRDQQTDKADINSGGRALEAVVRPYPLATAGEPLHLDFNVSNRTFAFIFKHDPQVTAPTEFFIPNFQYPQGYRVHVSDGTYEMDLEHQRLIYHHSHEQEVHTIVVKVERRARRR